MCMGASSSKSDGKMSEAHSMMSNSSPSSSPAPSSSVASTRSLIGTRMPAKAIKDPMGPAATKISTRPKTRSNNAYTSAGAKHERAGTRFNPSLLQRVLDISPTYNLFSSLGRKFNPKG